jgi:hypothetical protein
MTAAWDRDLNRDLDAIRDWGAATVVTLLEPEELTLLKVERLRMVWSHGCQAKATPILLSVVIPKLRNLDSY